MRRDEKQKREKLSYKRPQRQVGEEAYSGLWPLVGGLGSLGDTTWPCAGGVAFQAPPGSQASSRGEAKDSALLSSRDAGLLEPPERPQLPEILVVPREKTPTGAAARGNP